jgi:hypothetical protein
MTATPARQPQHCDHEIVCWMYRENKIPQGSQPCMRNHTGCEICNEDTRATHTSPPAPALFQIEPNSSKYSLEQIVEINENIQKQRKEAAKDAREQVLKECCAQCPIAEEIPVEDYCAESCEGCLVRMVVAESLRAQQEHHD